MRVVSKAVIYLVKVEELDLPVKRNQAFIVTYFSKTREKFCDHLLGEGEKKREERKEMLIKVLQFIDNVLAKILVY